MKRIELLSPAGNMDSLIGAVQAGADAVYLGGTLFGARAFAGNFNDDEIIEAIKYCHLRGVKVYVLVEKINLNTYDIQLEEGKQYQLETTILPNNATDTELEYISSNEDVATIDEQGVISGLNKGSCTLLIYFRVF